MHIIKNEKSEGQKTFGFCVLYYIGGNRIWADGKRRRGHQKGEKMKTLDEIRKDIREIRYYYTHSKEISGCENLLGKNKVSELAQKYNAAICNAPIEMYVLYHFLCVKNLTQVAIADLQGYTPEYINRSVKKMQLFLRDALNDLE